MENYVITGHDADGNIAYTIIVDTESQMIQELKDGLHDGFSVHIVKAKATKKGDEK